MQTRALLWRGWRTHQFVDDALNAFGQLGVWHIFESDNRRRRRHQAAPAQFDRSFTFGVDQDDRNADAHRFADHFRGAAAPTRHAAIPDREQDIGLTEHGEANGLVGSVLLQNALLFGVSRSLAPAGQFQNGAGLSKQRMEFLARGRSMLIDGFDAEIVLIVGPDEWQGCVELIAEREGRLGGKGVGAIGQRRDQRQLWVLACE